MQIKSEQGQRALLPLLEKEGLVMSYTPHNNEVPRKQERSPVPDLLNPVARVQLKAKVLDGVMRLPVPESALLAVSPCSVLCALCFVHWHHELRSAYVL